MSVEIILTGRPNSGKTTLFNRLASANQKVGNYAGCTVEKKSARISVDGGTDFEITDLPGLYSLRPNSMDEEVALSHLDGVRKEAHAVFVVDGNSLEQELVLPLMLKHCGLDFCIAVNMMDEVRANHKQLDFSRLAEHTGIKFFPITAKTGEGIEALKSHLVQVQMRVKDPRSALTQSFRGLPAEQIEALHREAREDVRKLKPYIQSFQKSIFLGRDLRIDKVLLNKFLGPVFFLLTMFVLFQSIFTWAKPISELIASGISICQTYIKAQMPGHFFTSLLSDGILAGVGAVLTFVPQIAILFLLIGVLESSGYLPRVAYMVDRLMKPFGLDGKVFIPLLSSVACAVPGIMATRTIENERTRLTTIMISPLMTCSARLPVYTLLISTFIPPITVFGLNLPGLVMFAMYLLGILVALAMAFVFHWIEYHPRKTVLDMIHLPHYRLPDWNQLFKYVWGRVSVFLRKAGTIITCMSIFLWAILSFPKNDEFSLRAKLAVQNLPASEQEARASQLEGAWNLEYSIGGRVGKLLAPAFKPIGYDWKLTIGVISSLAAREVFVSTLGTIFALGEERKSLVDTLRAERNAEGKPAYTIATCLSLLVFFAFSLQCISTIGVARRESNSWKIPAIMFSYMFVLAYGSAFFVFHLATAFI